MASFIILFVLSVIGIVETVYLIKKRISLQQPVCPIGENCATVLTSKYNKFFLIHNDVLGLLFYIVISLISSLLIIGTGSLVILKLVMAVLIAAGSLASLGFTYIQWKIVRAWCFWCLMSAFTVWLMGLTILLSNGI